MTQKQFITAAVRATAIALGIGILTVPSSFAATSGEPKCVPFSLNGTRDKDRLCNSGYKKYSFYCGTTAPSCGVSSAYFCADTRAECGFTAVYPLASAPQGAQGGAVGRAGGGSLNTNTGFDLSGGMTGNRALNQANQAQASGPGGFSMDLGAPLPATGPSGAPSAPTSDYRYINPATWAQMPPELRAQYENARAQTDKGLGRAMYEDADKQRAAWEQTRTAEAARLAEKSRTDEADARRSAKELEASEKQMNADAKREYERAKAEAEESEKSAGSADSPESGKRNRAKAGSECSVSGGLNSKYDCDGTNRLVNMANITNQAGQMAGSVTTSLAGQSAQQTALNSGTQSSAIQGAASTQRMAGMSQMAVGAVGMAMGFMQMQKGSKHSGYAKEIDQGLGRKENVYRASANGAESTKWNIDTGEGLQGVQVDGSKYADILDARSRAQTQIKASESDLSTARRELDEAKAAPYTTPAEKTLHDAAVSRAELNVRTKELKLQNARNQGSLSVSNAGRAVGGEASREQNDIARKARDGGMFSMLQAGQQITQAGLNLAAARQLESAAQQLQQVEQGQVTIAPPGQDPFPNVETRQPTTITGAGPSPTDGSAASPEQVPTDGGGAPLGLGVPQPQASGPAGDAPKAGAFVPGGPAAGGGGGGGFSMSGGSTQPAAPDNAVTGPTAAPNNVKDSVMVSGGAMVGPPAPGRDSGGINPGELMAAALGGMFKKDDPKDPSSQYYSGGNRIPASSEGSISGLSLPEQDIFKIIEDGYRRTSFWKPQAGRP